MMRWIRASTSLDAPMDTINLGLNIVYCVALLTLSLNMGLSLTVATLAAALVALHFGSQRASSGEGGWTRYLSYFLLLAEFALLVGLSQSVAGEWSGTLFLIYTASVMLNHRAYVAFPFVLTGYVLYLMFVEKQPVGIDTYVFGSINFSVLPLSLFGMRLLIRQRQQIMALNARLKSQAAVAAEMTRLRERNRLAEAVHDTMGHTLTASIVSLEGAAVLLQNRPAEAAALLNSVREQLQTGLGDIRQTVRTLRTDTLAEDTTLQESLVQLVERVRRQTSVVIDLQQRISLELLPIQDYLLYSVVREGLTNALKHAKATHIHITLETAQQRVALTIRNDGVGKSVAAPGFGLGHLRQKVTALGGTLATDTRVQGSFQIAVELPLALDRALNASRLGKREGVT